MKRSAQIITFLSSKIGLWFNVIRARWNYCSPRSNFPESRVAFPRYSQLNTDETMLMAGTEYFGLTSVQPPDHIPVNTMRKSHTFAALIRLSTITHNLLTFIISEISSNNSENSAYCQINTSGLFTLVWFKFPDVESHGRGITLALFSHQKKSWPGSKFTCKLLDRTITIKMFANPVFITPGINTRMKIIKYNHNSLYDRNDFLVIAVWKKKKYNINKFWVIKMTFLPLFFSVWSGQCCFCC